MNAATVKPVLDDTMLIDGAVGAVLVDRRIGMCLGTAGSQDLYPELPAADDTEVVKARIKLMSALALRDTIENILITVDNQYHLIRILKGESSLFVYLALNKANSNLAMARHQLSSAEKKLA